MRFAGLSLVVAAACVPVATPKLVAKPPPLVTPARWRLAPDGDWHGLAHVELGGGRVLWAGEQGERWVFLADGTTEREPVTMLPETIVGVLAQPSNRFAFVGASGHVYLTDDARGPVREVRPPPQPLRTITAGKAAFLAITVDDHLLRTTDAGSTWKPVQVDANVVGWNGVALGPDGRGLLLGVPGRLFRSDDDGASFARVLAKDRPLASVWVSSG